MSKDKGYKAPPQTTLRKNPFSTNKPNPPPGLGDEQLTPIEKQFVKQHIEEHAPAYLDPNQPIYVPPHLPQHTIPPSNSVSGSNGLYFVHEVVVLEHAFEVVDAFVVGYFDQEVLVLEGRLFPNRPYYCVEGFSGDCLGSLGSWRVSGGIGIPSKAPTKLREHMSCFNI